MKYAQNDVDGKTADELREMLAGIDLLTEDEDAVTLLCLSEAIVRKENKPPAEREADWMAFSSGLVERHAGQLPGGFVKSVRRRSAHRDRRGISLFMFGAITLFVVLAGGIATAYAFVPNLLQVVISFTDDALRKDIAGSPDKGSFGEQTLQDSLDALGIKSPRAPAWLPDGYSFGAVEFSAMPNRGKVSATYKSGDQVIVLTIIAYKSAPPGGQRVFEKDSGGIIEYRRHNIDFCIFSNMGTTVATWVDGLNDCDIQGMVSAEEMERIIDSMYEGKQ
jgi:nitrate reductase NapE component